MRVCLCAQSDVQLEAIRGASQMFTAHITALWESGEAFSEEPSDAAVNGLCVLLVRCANQQMRCVACSWRSCRS